MFCLLVEWDQVCVSACHAAANSDAAAVNHFKSARRLITISTERLRRARLHSMSVMMVSSPMPVECSAKIAMSALRDAKTAMTLLRDRNHRRCNSVGFRAREFVNQKCRHFDSRDSVRGGACVALTQSWEAQKHCHRQLTSVRKFVAATATATDDPSIRHGCCGKKRDKLACRKANNQNRF